MPPVVISPAAVEDADALTDLHLDVWDEAYGTLIPGGILRERRKSRPRRVDWWRRSIATAETTTLVARDGGRLVGFASCGRGRDDAPGLPALEVWALYVRAEFYGKGVGHALLAEAIGSHDAYLWVLDGNSRAVTFYERQGFRYDGVSKADVVGVERRMVRRSG